MATGRIPTTANSPLTVKGDLFGYSTTQARVPVGNDGETLVADSSASTGLNYKPLDAAGKNFIINGGMDIWQRGTSFVPAAVGYAADRWGFNNVSSATYSRQASGLTNFQYAMRIQRTAASISTNQISIYQSLETVNTLPLANKTVTVSFWARAGANFSPTSSLLGSFLYYGTGTDQNIQSSYTGTTLVASTNATLTTSWQRFTYTGTVSSSANELALGFTHNPTGVAGANDYADITGIQLELGSTATTFSRAGGTIQGELAACQRYYEKSYNIATPPGDPNDIGSLQKMDRASNATTTAGVSVEFKVTKRGTPSVTLWPSSSSTSGSWRLQGTIVAYTVYQPAEGSFVAFCGGAASGLTTGAGYIAAGHWAASAEL
jgi:hypothetical protein